MIKCWLDIFFAVNIVDWKLRTGYIIMLFGCFVM